MDIRQPKLIKDAAGARLADTPQRSRILLIYCGIVLGMNLVSTLLDLYLARQMSGAGGLGKLGTRAFLSSIQSLMPMITNLVGILLEFGLLAATLRIAREQYVSANTLRAGLQKAFPLLLFTLFQGAMYLGLAFIVVYVCSILFVLTPFSQPMADMLMPMLLEQSDPYALLDAIALDSELMSRLMKAMLPVYILSILVFIPAALFFGYRMKFCQLILLDDPRVISPFRALGRSFRLTRRHFWDLVRLDLSYWYVYLLDALTLVLLFGEAIASALGIALPWSQEVGSYLFYGLYLVGSGLVMYFLRPQLLVAQAIQYDALAPKEEPKNQVVLGNIFQM